MTIKEFNDKTKMLKKIEESLKKLKLSCNIDAISDEKIVLSIDIGDKVHVEAPKRPVIGFHA